MKIAKYLQESDLLITIGNEAKESVRTSVSRQRTIRTGQDF